MCTSLGVRLVFHFYFIFLHLFSQSVRVGNVTDMKAFFRTQGYIRAKTTLIDRVYLGEGVMSVTRLHNDSLRTAVDIVESIDSTAIRPIIGFYCTAIMNFVSATTVFCAYPDLTFRLRSMSNYIGSTSFPHFLPYPLPIRQGMRKYLERGFQFAHSAIAWAHDSSHTCASDPLCPHTLRSMSDGQCMFFEHKPSTATVPAHSSPSHHRQLSLLNLHRFVIHLLIANTSDT